jgi:uncharacterized membrane protein YdjX (TVP38/TMEM64 family)
MLSVTFFSIITAAGSFAVLWLYSVAGRKMEATLNAHQQAMHIVIGTIFIGLAVIELVKLLQPYF